MKTRSVAAMECVTNMINEFDTYESTHVWTDTHLVYSSDWVVARFINRMKVKKLKKLGPEVVRGRVIEAINSPNKSRWSDRVLAKGVLEDFLECDPRMVEVEERIINILDQWSDFDVRNIKRGHTVIVPLIGLYR